MKTPPHTDIWQGSPKYLPLVSGQGPSFAFLFRLLSFIVSLFTVHLLGMFYDFTDEENQQLRDKLANYTHQNWSPNFKSYRTKEHSFASEGIQSLLKEWVVVDTNFSNIVLQEIHDPGVCPTNPPLSCRWKPPVNLCCADHLFSVGFWLLEFSEYPPTADIIVEDLRLSTWEDYYTTFNEQPQKNMLGLRCT